MVELADVFRRPGPESRAKFQDRRPQTHVEAMKAIEHCRTEALGGHVFQGMECGALEYSDHACKHRHGPKCQHEEATPGLDQQRELLLPVPYLLVPLTRPEALRPIARSQQRLIYTRLFQTAAALKRLAMAPQCLGGQSGMVGVLHTWTRDLASHPHIHDLVPGGALSPAGSTWRSPHYQGWLVPVRARSTIFRGKFKEALTKAGLVDHVPPQVWPKDGGGHCEPAGTGHEVLTSLAPDLRRMALTNHRIEQLEDGHVTFRFKENGSHGWKHRTLPAEACLRRFLHHGLPKGVLTVRYYGFLSPHGRQALDQIRTLLPACPTNDHATKRGDDQEPQDTAPAPAEELPCRKCGGPLTLRLRLSPNPRGPPA